MIHPFVTDLSSLKETELEEKVQSLSRKYWMTTNQEVRNQISAILEMHQRELSERRAKVVQQQYQDRDKTLDSLIKVN
jgi:hypothetical protein